ncbi:hypothetical protein [Bdellovibrio sp. HCB209]|uniref:hypothetical protein n=1 Tax=Bdellovibrio sp. HCB209 TaxID=3394354 RepID=UPI0039B54208
MFFKSLITTLLITATPAWAQMMNPSLMGTGYWGGNQSCAYQQRPAQAMNTESEEVQEYKSQISELKKEIAEKQKEKKQYDREVKNAKSDIQKNLSDNYADAIMQHMDGFRRCSEYTGFNKSDSGDIVSDDESPVITADMDSDEMPEPPEGAEGFAGGPPPSGSGNRPMPPRGGGSGQRPSMSKAKKSGQGANSNMLALEAFSMQEWQSYCDARQSGAVFGAVCDNSRFRAGGGRSNSATCKKAISSYRSNSQKSLKLQDEIDSLNRDIENAQEDLKEARNDRFGTEGEVCLDCMAKNNSYNYQNQQTDMTSLITNVALGAGAMYAGYKTNQMVSENNANLGYPTQTPSVLSYGYPYLAAGVYGALSGGGSGQGGFGCGGGSSMMGSMGGMNSMAGMMGMGSMMGMGNMGSAFGYPSSMMGSMMGMSGGLYTGMGMNSMMNPYSMNSMYGNSMYGNSMYSMMNSMSNPYAAMNPYSMYGSSGSMYGMNPYSQYSAMNSLQQQMMMMNYQMSGLPTMSGIYGNTGTTYNNGVYSGYSSGYISPTGYTNSTVLPSGVITGSSYGSSSYLSPYSTLSNSVTVPGIVPYPTTTTTSGTSGLIYGTGR